MPLYLRKRKKQLTKPIKGKENKMNDFLTGLLVKFWDSFKAKNAKIATLIVLVLGTLVYFADQGTLAGVIDLPTWAASAIQWLGTILLALQGSRTSADVAKLNAGQPLN